MVFEHVLTLGRSHFVLAIHVVRHTALLDLSLGNPHVVCAGVPHQFFVTGVLRLSEDVLAKQSSSRVAVPCVLLSLTVGVYVEGLLYVIRVVGRGGSCWAGIGIVLHCVLGTKRRFVLILSMVIGIVLIHVRGIATVIGVVVLTVVLVVIDTGIRARSRVIIVKSMRGRGTLQIRY